MRTIFAADTRAAGHRDILLPEIEQAEVMLIGADRVRLVGQFELLGPALTLNSSVSSSCTLRLASATETCVTI
jgi:hypothetical protein